MYSGFAITKYSGRLMGAHQHVDRLARRHLGELLLTKNDKFPSYKDIVRFEGKDGPDGIKIKSPSKDEPWHYLSPFETDNSTYQEIITQHFGQLVKSLQSKNVERASFEAAWLAHAVVDGMTPAHHYPYEETLEELMGGKSIESRDTKFKKMVFKGDTVAGTIGNMYKVYGPKGLYTSHHTFEFGVMLLLRPLRLPDARPTEHEIYQLNELTPGEYFINYAREVAALDLYQEYLNDGWTTSLSNKIRHGLAPLLVKAVTLLWYKAALESGIRVPKTKKNMRIKQLASLVLKNWQE